MPRSFYVGLDTRLFWSKVGRLTVYGFRAPLSHPHRYVHGPLVLDIIVPNLNFPCAHSHTTIRIPTYPTSQRPNRMNDGEIELREVRYPTTTFCYYFLVANTSLLGSRTPRDHISRTKTESRRLWTELVQYIRGALL